MVFQRGQKQRGYSSRAGHQAGVVGIWFIYGLRRTLLPGQPLIMYVTNFTELLPSMEKRPLQAILISFGSL
jgi:hypothetical protein